MFVARCLDVEVTSDGATAQAAVDNLREALEVYFDSAVVGNGGQISLTHIDFWLLGPAANV